jgi:hypothetical protein
MKKEIIAIVTKAPISAIELFEQLNKYDLQKFTIVLRLLLDNNILHYNNNYQLICS